MKVPTSICQEVASIKYLMQMPVWWAPKSNGSKTNQISFADDLSISVEGYRDRNEEYIQETQQGISPAQTKGCVHGRAIKRHS